MTDLAGKAASPMDAASVNTPQEARLLPDLDARLDALLVECRKHQLDIYRCEGVRPNRSLPFLASVERLLDALCGVTSVDTYDDVIEALEDAV